MPDLMPGVSRAKPVYRGEDGVSIGFRSGFIKRMEAKSVICEFGGEYKIGVPLVIKGHCPDEFTAIQGRQAPRYCKRYRD